MKISKMRKLHPNKVFLTVIPEMNRLSPEDIVRHNKDGIKIGIVHKDGGQLALSKQKRSFREKRFYERGKICLIASVIFILLLWILTMKYPFGKKFTLSI